MKTWKKNLNDYATGTGIKLSNTSCHWVVREGTTIKCLIEKLIKVWQQLSFVAITYMRRIASCLLAVDANVTLKIKFWSNMSVNNSTLTNESLKIQVDATCTECRPNQVERFVHQTFILKIATH